MVEMGDEFWNDFAEHMDEELKRVAERMKANWEEDRKFLEQLSEDNIDRLWYETMEEINGGQGDDCYKEVRD